MTLFAVPDFGNPDRIRIRSVPGDHIADAAWHLCCGLQQDRDKLLATPGVSRNIADDSVHSIIPCPGRKRKVKRRTLAGNRRHPDIPSVTLNDLLTDRETNSRPRIPQRPIMQTFKNTEDPCVVFRWNSDAVILYGQLPHRVKLFRT